MHLEKKSGAMIGRPYLETRYTEVYDPAIEAALGVGFEAGVRIDSSGRILRR